VVNVPLFKSEKKRNIRGTEALGKCAQQDKRRGGKKDKNRANREDLSEIASRRMQGETEGGVEEAAQEVQKFRKVEKLWGEPAKYHVEHDGGSE